MLGGMTCYANLQHDALVIGNDLIERRFGFNHGHLIGTHTIDKRRGVTWPGAGGLPDVTLPGVDAPPSAGDWSVEARQATAQLPAHHRVTVDTQLGNLWLRRVFRLYDGVPAIACDLFLKGRADGPWRQAAGSATGDLTNIETLDVRDGRFVAPVIGRFAWPHWHVEATAVRFYDMTDRRNTLTATRSVTPYKSATFLEGNVLLGRSVIEDAGFFILKESPSIDAQVAAVGCDFVVGQDAVDVVGIGADPDELAMDEWLRCHGCVIGVADASEASQLEALRSYQHRLRRYDSSRDFQIMMSTWGDRNRDTKLGESWVLAELDAAARLGVTVYKLDDGWQTGRSSNSAFAGGSLERVWDRPDYWTPDPAKFPNGLEPIIDCARQLGIEIGLWFAPSQDDQFAHWQMDADLLIGLHRRYGVWSFKIDMVDVTSRRSEMNFRKMFDKVIAATDGQVIFSMDVTARRRYGYHWFREYGNTFIENRYTDWRNYYPHWTLRNLWMLSRYVPAQWLQVEFLNRWRNDEKYGDDPLRPGVVPFDYCFAIAMFAQPLAWFEATGLPAEAFDLAPLIATYQAHEASIHGGMIFGIGERPCGAAWTGFQSCAVDGGYLLVLRERNDRECANVALWNLAGRRLSLTAVAGHAADRTVEVDADGRAPFSLPEPFTFGLWRYETA